MRMEYECWFRRLESFAALQSWVSKLREVESELYSDKVRRDWPSLKARFECLCQHEGGGFHCDGDVLQFISHTDITKEELLWLHPWRKGPFDIGGVHIDTEWRSDWKWNRLAGQVDLRGKRILDIGCGNGYYLWRMLDEGAEWALGVDPYLPYVMQFACMHHFSCYDSRLTVLPIKEQQLPASAPVFQVIFSMGVLYHRISPLDHLLHCWNLLERGGVLILETIIISGQGGECLVPKGRYAKMKNVYFLPTVGLLLSWLRKVKFRELSVLNISHTTTEEQRTTEWMSFESLSDYLDPNDSRKTVEGYPAPKRVILKAEK